MSAAKHTPGPWWVLDDRNPGGAGLVVTSTAGGVVALITRPTSKEADAELIAAAPTLADVLVDVDTLMQCDCSPAQRDSGHLSDCWLPHLRERIHAALRSAGRAP